MDSYIWDGGAWERRGLGGEEFIFVVGGGFHSLYFYLVLLSQIDGISKTLSALNTNPPYTCKIPIIWGQEDFSLF